MQAQLMVIVFGIRIKEWIKMLNYPRLQEILCGDYRYIRVGGAKTGHGNEFTFDCGEYIKCRELK